MSEFLKLLQSGPRKRVALAELRQHYYAAHPDMQNSPQRSAELLNALKALEAEGALTLPARGPNWEQVGSPPLPSWVLLRREVRAAPASGLASVTWAPELGFWPELKAAQLEALRPINEFLLRRRGPLMLVPIKERSLEIYGDEKRLDAMATCESLFSARLPLSALYCFRVPQPLPYRAAEAPGRPVLVVENHNSYWSLGEWNQDARRYAAVVYGSGEAFRLTGRALQQVLHEVQGNGAEYLGDLDPKGVRIPEEFNQAAPAGSPTVHPANSFYQWLLDHGRRRQRTTGSLAQAGSSDWLGPELAEQVVQLWAGGHWIPQEALGLEQLLNGAF